MTRARVLRHPIAAPILRATERRIGRSLRFVRTDEMSYFDESSLEVGFGKPHLLGRLAGDWTWPNRLLLHEIGHAVLAAFGDDFDRPAARRIFHGGLGTPYDSALVHVRRAPKRVLGRPAVTLYGKTHPQEAWAEAFSFVVADVSDVDETVEVVRQLAYADWVIEKVTAGRRSWGRFGMPEVTVTCAECARDFDLECRSHGHVKGWVVDCPHCGSELECD